MANDIDLIKNLKEYFIEQEGCATSSDWERMIQRAGGTIFIKDYSSFTKYLDNIYNDKNINKLLVSKKYFYDFMIDKYIEFDKKDITEVDIKRQIQDIKIIEFRVLLPLFNSQINSEKVEIVGNHIIQFQSIDKFCEEKQITIPKEVKDIFKEKYFESVPFLETIVKARELEFAENLAKIRTEDFVHVLNFMLFFCYRDAEMISTTTKSGTAERGFIFSEQRWSIKFKKNSPYKARIALESCLEYLTDNKIGNKQIFNIFNNNDKNEIENRIYNAVNWIGLAIAEVNNSVAFMMANNGIESLLQYQPKEMISKSIVASMSEAIAFLLGNDFESRKGYEKKFKELYSIRSKIVHGKSSEVTDDQILEIIDIGVQLIRKLITGKEFKDASTMQKISNYIEKQRYTTLEEKE